MSEPTLYDVGGRHEITTPAGDVFARFLAARSWRCAEGHEILKGSTGYRCCYAGGVHRVGAVLCTPCASQERAHG